MAEIDMEATENVAMGTESSGRTAEDADIGAEEADLEDTADKTGGALEGGTESESEDDPADSVMESVTEELDRYGSARYECQSEGDVTEYSIEREDDGTWSVSAIGNDPYDGPSVLSSERFDTKEGACAEMRAAIGSDMERGDSEGDGIVREETDTSEPDLEAVRNDANEKYQTLIDSLEGQVSDDGTFVGLHISPEEFVRAVDDSGLKEIFGEDKAEDTDIYIDFISHYDGESHEEWNEVILVIENGESYGHDADYDDFMYENGNGRIVIRDDSLGKLENDCNETAEEEAHDAGESLARGECAIEDVSQYHVRYSGDGGADSDEHDVFLIKAEADGAEHRFVFDTGETGRFGVEHPTASYVFALDSEIVYSDTDNVGDLIDDILDGYASRENVAVHEIGISDSSQGAERERSVSFDGSEIFSGKADDFSILGAGNEFVRFCDDNIDVLSGVLEHGESFANYDDFENRISADNASGTEAEPMEDDPESDLSEELEYRGIQLEPRDLDSVKTELMDGLGLSAELSADWTERYMDGHENLENGWVQDLREDIEQFAHDYIDAFMNEDTVTYSLLPDYRDQPQQEWEDHVSYIGVYIGSEADKYLMTLDDTDNGGGYYGNTVPGDSYYLAYDLLYSTQAVFEKEALGGNMEDFRDFCGSPDDNNILNTAVRLDCTVEMINFVGNNGTLDDMQNIMAGYLDGKDSKLLYDSVQNGTFSGNFDTDFIRDAFSDIRDNDDLDDDDKETLCVLVIDNMILNPDFTEDTHAVRNTMINDVSCEYDTQDAIGWYWDAMVTDDLPDDVKSMADDLFDRLWHEFGTDDIDEDEEYEIDEDIDIQDLADLENSMGVDGIMDEIFDEFQDQDVETALQNNDMDRKDDSDNVSADINSNAFNDNDSEQDKADANEQDDDDDDNDWDDPVE